MTNTSTPATSRTVGGLYVRESGTPGSPAIVFLHGVGTSGGMWTRHIARLGGYHCLVPDLPGFGRSNRLPWISRSDTADRIAALIESRVPSRRAHVVGLSLGGSVAHTLLARRADLLDRVVIDGCGAVPWWGTTLLKLAVAAVSPVLHTRPVIAAIGGALALDDATQADLRAASPRAFRRGFADANDTTISREELAAACPTLLVAGERETRPPVRASNAALAALMPHAQAHYAPGHGHGWIGQQPDLHLRMVAAWVEGRDLPSQLRSETTAWDAAAVERLLDTQHGRSRTAEPMSARERVRGATRVERVSANDMLHLAVSTSTVPSQIAALLWTRPTRPFDIDAARAIIGERVGGVRRLRQRLESAPFGCGRPFWVDVAAFDAAAHVTELACPAPGDDRALLDVAAEVVTTPLDTSRPLWRMVYVTGLADGRVAVILVLHHVVADGIGGLEVLARLVDGGAVAGPAPTTQSHPTRRQLCIDALAGRWRAVRRVPTVLARLPAALREMGAGSGGPTPRTSLNRATGPTRRFAIARCRLDDARQAAHAHAATVNDVLLTATTGALGELLRRRGENVGALTVSVPVAAQGAVARSALGNRVGIRRVTLPRAGDPIARLGAVAAASHAVRAPQPAASAELIGPLFRLLSATGVLRWFIDHQRLTNTLVTNLHGPTTPLSLAEDPVTQAAGLNVAGGNLAVTFTALSYAGTLMITVSADPDLIPDVDRLAADVHAQLRHICAAPDLNSLEGS